MPLLLLRLLGTTTILIADANKICEKTNMYCSYCTKFYPNDDVLDYSLPPMIFICVVAITKTRKSAGKNTCDWKRRLAFLHDTSPFNEEKKTSSAFLNISQHLGCSIIYGCEDSTTTSDKTHFSMYGAQHPKNYDH